MSEATKPAGNPARMRAIRIAVGVIALLGLGWALWQWLVASRSVSTEDAYVAADTAQVTPLTSGTVKEVLVSDTQSVTAGQPLLRIDDVDARVQVAQASAELQKSIRRVRQYSANDINFKAQVAARGSDIARAEAQLGQAKSNAERAAADLSRRERAVESGAVSQEELGASRDQAATTRAGLAAAEAALAQAKQNQLAAEAQLQANHVLVAGADEDTNPEVASSKAKLDQARLDLSRTTVVAPVSGVISRRQVQVGQRVSTGAVLMSIVPVQSAYVDANFKEVQLKKVRVGQPVTLTSDLYGSGVKFHGRVVGFSGGTGSAFAIIPSQNATGNWIKVVQRVPVRVSLDPKELAQHPLRVGLSMRAVIDISAAGS